jgi:hypothetical protein
LGGGAAADVIGNVSVTPGQTLYVEVGGPGQSGGEGGAGGFNGGADSGGGNAGGGGGGSDIRTLPESAGLLLEDGRLIVAAGGGGSGSNGEASAGGAGGAAGSEGAATETGDPGGGAGTGTEGGAGGLGFFGTGGNGQLGSGGIGGLSEPTGGPGGGGGGGYYGGGGGGGGVVSGGGGGGGGSSLVPAEGLKFLASSLAAPKVEIIYVLVPPSISIPSPTNGATYTQGQAATASYSCTPPEGTIVATCEGPVANSAPLETEALGLHTFTVNAEDADGAKATKEVTYTVVAAPTPTPTPPAPPPVSPDTILGSHPKEIIKTTKKKVKVKFTFSSAIAGATFKCKLDKGSFAPCTSPKSYKVKLGKHTFSVEAVSAGGTDPTPATFSFKVKKKH